MQKKRRRKPRHNRFALFLSAMLFISILCFIVYEMKIRPVICRVAAAQAQSVAVSVINDEINSVIALEGVEYTNFATLEKDEAGRISAITTDMAGISRLKATFAQYVQGKLREIDKMTLRIPLGTLFSNGFISGYGPRVPIRITSVGRALVDIEDSFETAGINQTRHEIHLLVTARLSVILPGGTETVEIHTKIPIAQSVVVGEVPQSVTSVTGVNGEPQDNVLNLLGE